MGVMKRLYELRKLGRVDEPRRSRPPPPPAEVRDRRSWHEAARVYKRSKQVQLEMFEEEDG